VSKLACGLEEVSASQITQSGQQSILGTYAGQEVKGHGTKLFERRFYRVASRSRSRGTNRESLKRLSILAALTLGLRNAHRIPYTEPSNLHCIPYILPPQRLGRFLPNEYFRLLSHMGSLKCEFFDVQKFGQKPILVFHRVDWKNIFDIDILT
jgi:hypothetical protein